MIFEGLVRIRNFLFDRNLIRAERLGVPVVGIGNLTTGGTGKSAVTMALMAWAQKNGLRVGVLSRGYGRATKGVLEVDLSDSKAAEKFGDEPVMIKMAFPEAPFYVGEDRVQAGQALLKKHSVQLIFADDSFQHRRLWRDRDIVLMDVMQGPKHYRLLPFGRGREPLTSLARAHYVFLTKANLVSDQQLESLRRQVATFVDPTQIVDVLYQISHLQKVKGENGDLDKTTPVLAFGGLANPDSFFQLLSSHCQVKEKKAFPDHHFYSRQDVERLVEQAWTKGISHFVTTAKDVVKLAEHKELFPNLYVARLDVEFGNRFSQLEKDLFGLVR